MPDFHNVHSLVNFNRQSTLSIRPPALKKITTVASLNNTTASIASRIMPPALRPERNLSSAASQSFPFRNHADSKFIRSIQKIAPFSIAQKRPSSVMEITRGRKEQVKSKRFDPSWGASDILKSGSKARYNAKVKKSIQKNATQLLEKLSSQTKEKSESEKEKENLLSCIREEGRWDHDAIDIAVDALANACNIRIRIYDADVGMIADAGQEQNAQRTINLQRVRIRGYEHYQFIDNAGYVHDVAADGNCLFRSVSMALYGDQDSWIYLRGQTADHIENHYDIYREFVRVAPLELAPDITGQEKKLEDLLPDLTLSKPHVKDIILDNFLTTLQKDLRSFIGRSATPSQIVSEKDQRILRNALHHFLSIYDASRFQGIKETIAYLKPVEQKRILGRLQYRIERAQDGEYNLELNEQASRQKVREMASLKILANAITHDLVTVLLETGISPHQLLAFIELTEAATLLQEGQLLGTALEDLGEIVLEMEKDPDLPEDCQRIREPAVQEKIDNLKECFEKDLIELAHFVNNIDFEGHFFLNEQQLDENYSAENYNYTDNLEVVLAREGVIKEHLIANRVRRLLEHRHLQRLPMSNLHEDAAYNSPLFMTRSVINPEERGLYYDGRLSVKNLKHHLRNNRAARLASLRQHMIGAPFILGEGKPVTGMNLDGLDYGDKGLSYKFLYQELIDNRNISIFRLNRIGLWSNTIISKITKTGMLDFHWMDDFPDDVLELLFCAFRNPEQNGDHDSLLLFSALQRIGKKLNGDKFDEHQFGKLIQDGLYPYTLEKLSLKVDELAYLLFLFPNGVDGGRGILDIAALINQEPVEGEIPYNPHADWKKLVTSLAMDKTWRARLEERLQVLQTAIDDIPWERLCHYLARHTNIMVVEQNQVRDFVADYQPNGVVSFIPPADQPNEPWLLLRPDYLEVYDGEGVSLGEFFRFENTGFSALRAIIDSEASIFYDTHGRFPTDSENREALERLAKQILALHKAQETRQNSI
ncbi:OTU domain-containing protein [Pantoea sp. App145]|uniref:OTU domain-containing protein n=1 Tax=Pantoea sp. App145 TaxID=3071567 RepID=UPI003A80BA58